MSDSALIPCVWTGEVFEPRPGFAKRASVFGVGEIVVLEAMNERSMRSHRHQWAVIHDLWLNLPETLAEMPYAKTAETLRKHALIATGYADVQTIDAGSKAAAERVGAYLSALATQAHGYAIVRIEGPVVRVYTPQSQSVLAVGGEVFQASKTAVLEWLEALVAVPA